ncbi:MAG: hypothetical protein H7249_11740 [Chitinophagaceae bacterium]|nr:hypothetical protein [Oligoflexus sp.]
MKHTPIYIDNYDCLTPAGRGVDSVMRSLFAGRTELTSTEPIAQGSLPFSLHDTLQFLTSEKSLREHDPLTLMGVMVGRSLSSGLQNCSTTGLIVGSSRGPTQTLEKSFAEFSKGVCLKPSVSPTSTASGISSAIARDLKLGGPSFSLSAACSTGLYALLQGIGSLKAGLCDDMIVGGVEAANTDFTFEMLRSARVLNTVLNEDFPCRPGSDDRRGMVLSEGAALLHLTSEQSARSKASVIGWGAANESGTLTGVSENGEALAHAIHNALQVAGIAPDSVDLIVGHGAGTLKGDKAEAAAYRSVFGAEARPPLVWHKWCVGHMLGASAALSVMLAVEHLERQELSPHPYFADGQAMFAGKHLVSSKIALITSMGFGGSACALLVKKLS